MRGIAVILVFLHHHAYLNSGWLGVDLFFVLSGYLITTILRASREDIGYWQEFWIKRATRILPPLVLLLCITAICFQFSPLRLAGYLFSFGDVLAYTRPVRSLDALWSLAVEEHFYLLWPFAVRFLSRRSLFYILVGALVAEPLLRGFVSTRIPGWEAIYYLTPFRLDGLCFGSLLAIGFETDPGRRLITRWSLPSLGCSVLVWFAFRILLGTRFTRDNPSVLYNAAVYSIISLSAFSFIAYLVTKPASRLARLLSLRPLVFVGIISYGLYLYQLVVREIVVSVLHFSYRRAIYVDLPVSFLIAWLSYTFLESPLILWGRRQAQMRKARENLMQIRPTV